MRLYGAVAVRGFRRYATYRVATLAGVFTNTVFGFIMTYTYIALWTVRPHLGGYDVPQVVTYAWLGQALLMTTALMGGGFETDLGERIRTGDVAVDLCRPADLQLWCLATDLGRAVFHLLGRGVAPMAFAALVFPLAWPAGPAVWGLFLLSVLLAVVVSYGLRYLVALTGFWLLDGNGATTLSVLVALFFSGMVLPTMKKLEYIVELKRVIRRKFTLGTGDGWLKADGETIYTAKDLRVGLFQAGDAAPAQA